MISDDEREPKPDDPVQYGIPSWLVTGGIIVWGQLSPARIWSESRVTTVLDDPVSGPGSQVERRRPSLTEDSAQYL